MNKISVFLTMLLCFLMSSVVMVKSSADMAEDDPRISSSPTDSCRKGMGESCRPGSTDEMNCCQTGMECKSIIKPGCNRNSTRSGKCCLGKNSPCTEIGSRTCCQGYSCEKSPNEEEGLKCQEFFHESSRH